jgi:uncharacterized protein (DUF433 family)
MITPTEHPYIVRQDDILGGEPIIKGTRVSVRCLVENWRLGIPPDEMPLHFPHLTMAAVFDALSYYSDHQDDINRYIERNHVPDSMLTSGPIRARKA